MINKKYLFISYVILLIAVIACICVYPQLPEQIAIHFNSKGVADGFQDKFFGIFGLQFFLIAIHTVVIFFTRFDPKRKNIPSIMWNLLLFTIPCISIFVTGSILAFNLGYTVNTSLIVGIFIGILMIILGNYLPKTKRNYSVGIKVPWALDNDDNWNATHRMGGLCMSFGGLIMIICALFNQLMIGVVILLTFSIFPMIYSFIYYKKHQQNQ